RLQQFGHCGSRPGFNLLHQAASDRGEGDGEDKQCDTLHGSDCLLGLLLASLVRIEYSSGVSASEGDPRLRRIYSRGSETGLWGGCPLIILFAVCPAWYSSFGIADSSNATEGVRFALFWPREASALEAARMFDDIFQPWLKTAWRQAGGPRVNHGRSSVSCRDIQLGRQGGQAGHRHRGVVQSGGLDTPGPSDVAGCPTLAELLLRVLRVSLRLPSNHPDRAFGPASRPVVREAVQPGVRRPSVRSESGRSRSGALEKTEAAAAAAFMALEKLERQGVRDLLVVATGGPPSACCGCQSRRRARGVYGWLVFNGLDMTDSSSGTQWPNPSLNVTTVEYQKPRTELLKRVLSNRTDSLLLYDQMSLWPNAWPTCTAPILRRRTTVVTGLTGDFLLSSNGSIERLNWRFDIYRGLLVEAE
uniref:IU_nuc_hydro domain-containing protein n=1 Tax=Macrostomum lignano TaxID=282301 RepID=A0A1I8FGH5_9PLAT